MLEFVFALALETGNVVLLLIPTLMDGIQE
jgi:hypothetical protein